MKDSAKGMTAQALSWQGLWETFRAKVIGRKFVQDVGVLTVANAVGVVLSFIQAILIARWLGPKLYGVAALVMAYPAVLFGFIDTRSAQASVKYLGEFEAKRDSARALAVCKLGYTVDMAIAILAFMLVAATAWWAEKRIVQMPGMTSLIILYAAAFIPSSLARTSSAVMRTFGRFPALAKINGLCAAVRTTLVVGLVWMGYGVAGVVWGNALVLALRGLMLSLISYPVAKQAWGSSWLWGRWHTLRGVRWEIAGFFFYNNLNGLMGVFVRRLDLIVLGYFRGPTEAGYYSLAKSVGAVLNNLRGPLRSVSYPRLARLWGGGQYDELRGTVKRYALLGVGISFGALALVAVPLLPTAIGIVVGEKYLPAVFACRILFLAGAISLGMFWVRPLYLAAGRVRSWFGLSLISGGFAIMAYPVGAVLWGASGVALGRMAAGIIRLGLATIQILRGRVYHESTTSAETVHS